MKYLVIHKFAHPGVHFWGVCPWACHISQGLSVTKVWPFPSTETYKILHINITGFQNKERVLWGRFLQTSETFFFLIVRNEEQWCKKSCYTWVGKEGVGEEGLSLQNPTKWYNSQCLQPMKILMTELKLDYACRSQQKLLFVVSEHGWSSTVFD